MHDINTQSQPDDVKKEAAKMLKKINEVAERSENLENQVSTWTISSHHLLACGRAKGLGALTSIDPVLWRNDMIAIILTKLLHQIVVAWFLNS